MESVPAPQALSAQRVRPVWQLQARQRLVLRDWVFQKVEQAYWEWSLSLIEPIRRVWTSLRPELRADPPSASVSHFPAAASRGIWFRPA